MIRPPFLWIPPCPWDYWRSHPTERACRYEPRSRLRLSNLRYAASSEDMVGPNKFVRAVVSPDVEYDNQSSTGFPMLSQFGVIPPLKESAVGVLSNLGSLSVWPLAVNLTAATAATIYRRTRVCGPGLSTIQQSLRLARQSIIYPAKRTFSSEAERPTLDRVKRSEVASRVCHSLLDGQEPQAYNGMGGDSLRTYGARRGG